MTRQRAQHVACSGRQYGSSKHRASSNRGIAAVAPLAAHTTPAPAAASCPAASFNDLPDELVLRILSLLDLQTRVGVAALVCPRWHALTHSAPLLCTLGVSLRRTPALPLDQAATSFSDWFYEHAAPHVQSLHLVLPFEHESPHEDIEFAIEELAGTLEVTARERGCKLQDLRIAHWFENHEWEIPEDCWGLTSLRRLSIHVPDSGMSFHCRPGSLPLLTDLELVGGVDFDETNLQPLPPSLTRLRLPLQGDDWEEEPLRKILCLAGLKSLVLDDCCCDAMDYAELLLQMRSSPKSLGLIKCREVPECLGSLTGLEVLYLSCTPEHAYQADVEQLASALQQLTQLTALIINHSDQLWHAANLAVAIADLPLQHLSILGSKQPQHDSEVPWTTPAALVNAWPLALPPPGRWQAQLRELALPASTAAAGLAQLAAAPQLEALTLLNLCSIPAAQQEALLSFAGHHPTLRHLRLDASGPYLSAATFAAVSGALRANRVLRLLPGLNSGDASRLAAEAWEACSGGGGR